MTPGAPPGSGVPVFLGLCPWNTLVVELKRALSRKNECAFKLNQVWCHSAETPVGTGWSSGAEVTFWPSRSHSERVGHSRWADGEHGRRGGQ